MPGVAKTLLVRTLAHVMRCDFARIQFTPDLMPTDITGTHVFNLQKDAFSLVKGPVFTTFLLADEINRAPAKTQSALLQAMQERTVTIDRKTHKLSPNFTVFAIRIQLNTKAIIRCPKRKRIDSCLRSPWIIPAATKNYLWPGGCWVRSAGKGFGQRASQADYHA